MWAERIERGLGYAWWTLVAFFGALSLGVILRFLVDPLALPAVERALAAPLLAYYGALDALPRDVFAARMWTAPLDLAAPVFSYAAALLYPVAMATAAAVFARAYSKRRAWARALTWTLLIVLFAGSLFEAGHPRTALLSRMANLMFAALAAPGAWALAPRHGQRR